MSPEKANVTTVPSPAAVGGVADAGLVVAGFVIAGIRVVAGAGVVVGGGVGETTAGTRGRGPAAATVGDGVASAAKA
jgi:hypothetical protein